MSIISKRPDYFNRDFDSIRKELEDILKIYYPDQYQDFNVASPGMANVDLLAYMADILSYYTDKRFNELFIDGVTEPGAAFRLARTLGFKLNGVNASSTLVDFIVEVPPSADGPDTSYLPLFRPGTSVAGNGVVFETREQVDFSSDFSEDGIANRKIEPIFNANQTITKYKITKREKVFAGASKVFKLETDSAIAATEFYELTLKDTNVLEISGVIVKSGLNQKVEPTFAEWNSTTLKYYEVNFLANDKVFLEDDTVASVNGVKTGANVTAEKRFIKDFNSDGTCTLTFGGGSFNHNAYQDYLDSVQISDNGTITVRDALNNLALGYRLPTDSTVWVKYRIGGGELSNIGSGAINKIANVDAVIAGADTDLAQRTIASTRATNIIPALGGADILSVEEAKHFIAANYAAQERCVTLEDYISRAYQIPGKFGRPFRIFGEVNDNKVKLYILALNANGRVALASTNIIKNNIVEYLVPFRMINDFVEITDGFVVNLSMEADLFIDRSYNPSEVKAQALSEVKTFFDIKKWHMNQNIYISQITDNLREIPGVINVVGIRFFNIIDGKYSTTIHPQAGDSGGFIREVGTAVQKSDMEPINNALFSSPKMIFEVRFPDSDIKIRHLAG